MAKADPGERIRREMEKAALLGVKRMERMFADEKAGNGDAVKALALLLDHLGGGEADISGEYEVKIQE